MSESEHDIFLSYSRKDLEVVTRFRDRLLEGGYRVWMDQERIRTGESWRGALTKAIQQAQCLILMVSSSSVASRVVRKEVGYARKKGIPIYLIYLEPSSQVTLDDELEFEHGDEHREKLDLVTCDIPPNLIETFAEKHRLFVGAFHEKKKAESTGDKNLDRRLDEYAKLLDRVDHQRRFRESLMGDEDVIRPKRPVLILVHGPENQEVEDFRESLSTYHLHKLREEGYLQAKYSRDDVHVVSVGGAGLRQHGKEQFDSLLCHALLRRSGSRERVLNFLTGEAEHCKVVTFRVHVPDADAKSAKRFVRAFFQYWGAFPAVPDVILLVKLEVTYPSPKSRIARFLDGKAAKLARRCPRCFLPALRDVPEAEAKDWIEGDNQDIREFLTGAMGFTTGEVRHHIREAYRAAQCTDLPMAELEPSLQGRLKQAYRNRSPLT